MVFNVFAINTDDHTKNISFLLDESGKYYAGWLQGGGGTHGIRKYPGIIDQVKKCRASWDESTKNCGFQESHREEISQELLK